MPGIDSFTKLLLPCDGTDASTSFPDSSASAHSVTAIGNAQVDTAQMKFGSASALFDGSGDYLSIPDSSDWDFGTNDLTLDCWVRFNSTSGNKSLYVQQSSGTSYTYWAIEGTSMRFRDYTGVNNIDFARTISVTTGVWYHMAVIRTGNTFRMFVDGVQQGADYTNSNVFTNRTASIFLGGWPLASYFLNGWFDEFRISNGVARWTTDFTPPTAPYDSDNEESVDLSEEIEVSDEIEMQLDTDLGEDEVEISDEGIFKLAKSQEDSEEIEVSDEIDIDVGVNSQEEVIISDEIEVNIPVEYLDLSEEVVIGDSSDVNLIIPSEFASSIISVNPLIFVTDDDPVQVVKVDTTDPVNPTWTVKIIDETGVDTKNAKDIAYDSVEDVLYVATAEGKLLKINFSDLDVLEEIDLVDTDDLIDVEIHEDFRRVLVATDQTDGEVITLEDVELQTLTTDVRTLLEISKSVLVDITTGFAKTLTADVRVLGISKAFIKTDVRVINFDYSDISANVINRTDADVKINGVSVDDVKQASIHIRHMAEQGSEATFILARKHDHLDKMYDGSDSEITNQNDVKIYIKGIKEFEGKVSRIDCQSETENVQITAQSEEIKEKDDKSIVLPMSLLNEKLHPYHVLVHNPSIYNPFIDPDNEDNPEFYKGIKVDLGLITRQNVERWQILNDTPEGGLFSQIVLGQPSLGSTALDIMEGNFKPKQNWTYFWGPITAQNFSTGNVNTAFYVGTSMGGFSSDTWELLQARYRYQRIREDFQSRAFGYSVSAPGFITQVGLPEDELRELPIDAPQRLKLKTEYRIGEAPFQEKSVRNGALFPKWKWEDREHGLYEVLDSKYDFRRYAVKVANLEYEKLQTINGEISPKTEASIETLLDGYYYNGIKMLTRINIDNTTTDNIYNSNNGFPVSVKSIDIDFSSMRVTLTCDNSLALCELEEIDDRYPDEEDFIDNPEEKLLQVKFDVNRDEDVE